jgi:hypothetical protein
MKHFSDSFFASEFPTRPLDLRPSMNDKNIRKRTSFRPLLMCVQTHVIDFVRVSGEALGTVRRVTAFDRLPVNAEHGVN